MTRRTGSFPLAQTLRRRRGAGEAGARQRTRSGFGSARKLAAIGFCSLTPTTTAPFASAAALVSGHPDKYRIRSEHGLTERLDVFAERFLEHGTGSMSVLTTALSYADLAKKSGSKQGHGSAKLDNYGGAPVASGPHQPGPHSSSTSTTGTLASLASSPPQTDGTLPPSPLSSETPLANGHLDTPQGPHPAALLAPHKANPWVTRQQQKASVRPSAVASKAPAQDGIATRPTATKTAQADEPLPPHPAISSSSYISPSKNAAKAPQYSRDHQPVPALDDSESWPDVASASSHRPRYSTSSVSSVTMVSGTQTPIKTPTHTPEVLADEPSSTKKAKGEDPL